MEKCLICNKEFNDVSQHIKKHHITIIEYKRMFNLILKCKTCGKELSKNNRSGYCNIHRDRTGANNPFFGKTHSVKTIRQLKEKCAIASKKMWEDDEYRNKVITNSSKPRSEQAKKNISEAVTKWYEDNPNEREKRSEYMKNYWKNGNIVTNNFAYNRSNLEDELYNDLKEIYPTIMKKQTLRDVNGKWYFPDMVLNECNLIIEFYGDYWHANPKLYNENDVINNHTAKEIWEHDQTRVYNLEHNIQNINYKVLIIWQNDFVGNEKLVLQKLQEYINDRLHTMET